MYNQKDFKLINQLSTWQLSRIFLYWKI